MPDREKVIKGLEICIRVKDNEKCPDECPYRKDICYGTVGLMADALSLLKEQEPIAPKLIKMYPHDIYECGNCGHRSVGSKDYKAKYCPECGQAVKWDESPKEG